MELLLTQSLVGIIAVTGSVVVAMLGMRATRRNGLD
jgi:hypothetical protein